MQSMHSLKILAISYEETLKLNTDKHVLYLGFKEFDKITFNGQYFPFGFKTVKKNLFEKTLGNCSI